MNEKVEITPKIKEAVGNLLVYMDDERKDYENCLENDPDFDGAHIWLDIKTVVDLIGLSVGEAWDLYSGLPELVTKIESKSKL